MSLSGAQKNPVAVPHEGSRGEPTRPSRAPVPTGPRGWPIVGILPRVWRDPLRFFQEVALEHGGVARIGIGKFTLFLISSPDAIAHILQDHAANFWKGSGLAAAERVMGQGLATSEGKLWERQTRMIQPLFRPQRLAVHLPALQELTREALDRWRDKADGGQLLDAAEAMRRLTLAQISRLLFGSSLGDEELEIIGRAVEIGNDEIRRSAWTLVPFLSRLPTPHNVRFRRAMAALDALMYRQVRERRERRREGDGLLGELIDARDEVTGETMTDRQLRDELVTFYVAGHDTPAKALAWTFHLLAEHPAWAARAAAEAEQVLGAVPATLESLDRLVTAEHVLKESLRLYPPAWIIVRTPHADDVIQGYAVPAGAPLLICQYAVHRHPQHWDRPADFDPDRWCPERSAARHRFAFLPFGGGSRFCTGHHLAMLLGKLVVAEATRSYQWTSAPGRRVVPHASTTLAPRGGVWIRVAARGAATAEGLPPGLSGA